jgi:16S rRNA processing protein RimM
LSFGEPEPAWPDDAIQVAYIMGAWGVQGWIKIQALASDPQALFSSRRWFLNRSDPDKSGSAAPAKGLPVVPLGLGSGGVRSSSALKSQSQQQQSPLPPLAAAPFELPRLVRVAEVKHHSTVVVAKLQEVADRFGAEQLKGLGIFVSRASFPTPDRDEFYWVDLLGLTVVNRAGESLGVVVGLLDNGPHQVLRIQHDGQRDERLVPFVSAYVDDVDLAQKLITVDWGLDY